MAMAALNHPNIAGIFGLDYEGGLQALADKSESVGCPPPGSALPRIASDTWCRLCSARS